MKPGDLVSVHEIDFRTNEFVEGEGFLLGNMSGKGSDLCFPSGTPAVIVDMGHFPDLVNGEEILILLVAGHIGWAYKQECRVLRGERGVVGETG